MAKVIESKKDFKLIGCNSIEVTQVLHGNGVCDSCSSTPLTGIYIAVLNSWYCKECFNDWHENAKNHKSDKVIEDKNFDRYKKHFAANTKENEETIVKIKQVVEGLVSMQKIIKGNEFVVVEPLDLLCYVTEPGKGINGTNAAVEMGGAYLFKTKKEAKKAQEETIVYSNGKKVEFVLMIAAEYYAILKKRNIELLTILTA